MIRLASVGTVLQERTMLTTILVMSIVALLACAAVIALFEHFSRARHPQVGPPPRRRAF
jgi:hypothetical protein